MPLTTEEIITLAKRTREQVPEDFDFNRLVLVLRDAGEIAPGGQSELLERARAEGMFLPSKPAPIRGDIPLPPSRPTVEALPGALAETAKGRVQDLGGFALRRAADAGELLGALKRPGTLSPERPKLPKFITPTPIGPAIKTAQAINKPLVPALRGATDKIEGSRPQEIAALEASGNVPLGHRADILSRQAAQIAVDLVPSVVAGWSAGLPAALAVSAVQNTSSELQKLKATGKFTDEEALNRAGVAGGIMTSFDAIPLGKIIRLFGKGSRTKIREVLEAGLSEGAIETAQEFVGLLSDIQENDRLVPFIKQKLDDGGLQQLITAGTLGTFIGTGLAGISAVAQSDIQRRAEQKLDILGLDDLEKIEKDRIRLKQKSDKKRGKKDARDQDREEQRRPMVPLLGVGEKAKEIGRPLLPGKGGDASAKKTREPRRGKKETEEEVRQRRQLEEKIERDVDDLPSTRNQEDINNAVIHSPAAPISQSQRSKNAKQKLLKSAKKRRVLNFVMEEQPHVANAVFREIIEAGDRRHLKDVMSSHFIRDVKTKANEIQRMAIPLIMEKQGLPKHGDPEIMKIINNPEFQEAMNDPQMIALAEYVGDHLDEMFKYQQENRTNFDIEAVKNYVTHIWKLPEQLERNLQGGSFPLKNPFHNKRSIGSFKEGIEMGGIPKVLDIAEIIGIYDAISIRTTENDVLLREIKKMHDEFGVRLIKKGTAKNIPANFMLMDHPALNSRFGKAMVHPAIAKEMRLLFDKRHSHLTGPHRIGTIRVPQFDVLVAYELVNAGLKKTWLSISLFHHLALEEVALGVFGTRGPIVTAKILRKMISDITRGKWGTIHEMDIFKDGIPHGLRIGAVPDVQRTIFRNALLSVEKGLKARESALHPAFKKVLQFNDLWDTILWDYLHNLFKAYGYETLVERELSQRRDRGELLRDIEVKKIKEEVAAFVNDTFGGQDWLRLGVGAKGQQMMQWNILSPDWLTSTTRQALAPLGLFAKHSRGHRFRMGRAFWASAALYYLISMNGLNWLFSKWQEEKDRENPEIDPSLIQPPHFMFQNEPGQQTRLFLGRNPDGTLAYARFGKQFKDFPELFWDLEANEFSPFTASQTKLGAKAAPIPQMITKFFTDKTLGGFEDRELARSLGTDKFMLTIDRMFKEASPFSFRSFFDEGKMKTPFAIAFPISRGMTWHKAKRYYRQYIMDEDLRMILEVWLAAMRNGVDGYAAWDSTIRDLTGELDKAIREEVQKADFLPKTEREFQVLKQQLESKKKMLRHLKHHRQVFDKIKIDLENARPILEQLDDRKAKRSLFDKFRR